MEIIKKNNENYYKSVAIRTAIGIDKNTLNQTLNLKISKLIFRAKESLNFKLMSYQRKIKVKK